MSFLSGLTPPAKQRFLLTDHFLFARLPPHSPPRPPSPCSQQLKEELTMVAHDIFTETNHLEAQKERVSQALLAKVRSILKNLGY
jgi:hypothetical protein